MYWTVLLIYNLNRHAALTEPVLIFSLGLHIRQQIYRIQTNRRKKKPHNKKTQQLLNCEVTSLHIYKAFKFTHISGILCHNNGWFSLFFFFWGLLKTNQPTKKTHNKTKTNTRIVTVRQRPYHAWKPRPLYRSIRVCWQTLWKVLLA